MNDYTDNHIWGAPAHSDGKNKCDNQTSVQSDVAIEKPRLVKSSLNPNLPLSFNRTKHSIPYKSEMCLQFKRGKCSYGENCHFSHSQVDIRSPGLNVDGMKVKECHWFSSGLACPYGDCCQFSHKVNQNARSSVGLCRNSSAVNSHGEGSDRARRGQTYCRSMDAEEGSDKLAFRKTKLCHQWQRFGSCPYGLKCNFAHGKEELPGNCSTAEMEYGHIVRSTLAPERSSVATYETGMKTFEKLQLKGKKYFTKWNIEHVSQIYGDWIQDSQN